MIFDGLTGRGAANIAAGLADTLEVVLSAEPTEPTAVTGSAEYRAAARAVYEAARDSLRSVGRLRDWDRVKEHYESEVMRLTLGLEGWQVALERIFARGRARRRLGAHSATHNVVELLHKGAAVVGTGYWMP